jgi:putative heme iron utilization protein
MINPIRPTDDEARALARRLLVEARTAALAVLLPDGAPQISRIALGRDDDGMPLAFLSDLSQHSRALRSDPRASLLVGEPGPKGDPLTHPRLTLNVRAIPAVGDRDALVRLWLDQHPKAAVYAGLPDFHFVRFEIAGAFLNGGFGRAFRLTPGDLGF